MNRGIEEIRLSDRAREILKHVVREFVRTGRPVGSKTIANLSTEALSSATVRNVMADLEAHGLLAQPHTSAGRAPTADGYRVYIDDLSVPNQLPERVVQKIRLSLSADADATHLMSRTSEVLSLHSGVVGFVLEPRPDSTVMKHVKFVGMADNRILVILVDQAGLVRHRVIHYTERLDQRHLDEAGNYLERNFAGVSLATIRIRLLSLLKREETLYDQMLQTIILLGSVGLGNEEEGDTEPALYLGGTGRILRDVSAEDLDSLQALFNAIEEKRFLLQILDRYVEKDAFGPTVKIGLDEETPGLAEFSLIAATYAYDGAVNGRLGLLGPRRMEYEKAISVVACVAGLVGEAFAGNRNHN